MRVCVCLFIISTHTHTHTALAPYLPHILASPALCQSPANNLQSIELIEIEVTINKLRVNMERLVNNQFQFQVYHTQHTHADTSAFFPRDKQNWERAVQSCEGKRQKFLFCCFFFYLSSLSLSHSSTAHIRLSTAWAASCVECAHGRRISNVPEEKSINIDVLSAI